MRADEMVENGAARCVALAYTILCSLELLSGVGLFENYHPTWNTPFVAQERNVHSSAMGMLA